MTFSGGLAQPSGVWLLTFDSALFTGGFELFVSGGEDLRASESRSSLRRSLLSSATSLRSA
jgi:hypothetical protein